MGAELSVINAASVATNVPVSEAIDIGTGVNARQASVHATCNKSRADEATIEEYALMVVYAEVFKACMLGQSSFTMDLELDGLVGPMWKSAGAKVMDVMKTYPLSVQFISDDLTANGFRHSMKSSHKYLGVSRVLPCIELHVEW